MILTNCAACAAPLAHDAPRCVRCKIRYEVTLRMRDIYATALYYDPDATLEDLREAVTTLDDLAPTARRVLGGAHPLTVDIEEQRSDERRKTA